MFQRLFRRPGPDVVPVPDSLSINEARSRLDLPPAGVEYYDRFEDICNQMVLLHNRKGADYGGQNDPYANVRASQEFGVEPWVGALIRLNDKITRIKSFIRNGKLANESLKDSIDDIGVYAVIMRVLYEEAHPEVDGGALRQPFSHNYTPEGYPTFRRFAPEWADAATEEHHADTDAPEVGILRADQVEANPELEPPSGVGGEVNPRIRHVMDALNADARPADPGPGTEPAPEAPEGGEAEPPAGQVADHPEVTYEDSPNMCFCDMLPEKPHMPHLMRQDLDDPELRLRQYVIQQTGLVRELGML